MTSGDRTTAPGVQHTFFRHAHAQPDALALATSATDLTYGELAGEALCIAGGLEARGVTAGHTVGVCLPRDERLIAAILGVLAAGAAYVPIDPRHVSERTGATLASAGVSFVIDESTVADVASTPLPGPAPVRADALAYVIFTSGSTGEPKGVAIEHHALDALLDWAHGEFDETETHRCSAVASVAFDFSVLELFLPLTTGGAIVLADDVVALRSHRSYGDVTLLQSVPAAAALLLDRALPPSLRTVMLGGERLPRAFADRAYANPGVRRVLNAYGPTENTVVSTVAEVERDASDEPPIGTPIGATKAFVVDEHGREVSDEAAGELWLAGPQLARGYLGRPDLTAEAFRTFRGERAYRSGDLARRISGELHYLGRADGQVKLRGFRVELGDIDAALHRLPGVRRGATAVHHDVLVGYVEGDDIDPECLRARLRERLPYYLVPSRFVAVDALPLGPTGKIDRSRLRPPQLRPLDDDPPVDDLERSIAELAGGVLHTAVSGRHVPLDALGLHSLAAARLVAGLAERHGRAVAPGVALAGATVADIAAAVRAAPVSAATVDVAEVQPGDEVELTELQRQMWVLRELAHDPAVTSVGIRLRLDPAPDTETLRAALTELTAVHPTLRMAVEATPSGPRGRIMAPAVLLHEATAFGELAPVQLDGTLPAMRATLVRDGAGAELALVADHIALDGWGASILAEDLDRLLSGAKVEQPALTSWRVAAMERQSETDETAARWRARRQGLAPPADPLGLGTGVRTTPARGHRVVADGRGDARALASSAGVSEAAAHLAILAAVLHRMTGDDTIVVGVAAAQRHRPGAERVVAPLLAVLPVAVTIGPDDTMRDLARQAGAQLAEALVDIDTVTSHRMPTPVMLSVQPDTPVHHGRVSLLGELNTGASQADLTVLVNRTVAGPQLQVEYDPGTINEEVAAAFVRRYLNAITVHPDARAVDLAVVLPDEAAWLETVGAGPPCGPVVDIVDAVLRHRPDTVAVRGNGATRTYQQLRNTAQTVAARLQSDGVTAGDTVGVCLTRDVDLPGRLLGVLLAGAGYVPVDTSHPRARIEFALSNAGCRVTLVDPSTAALVPGGIDVTVIEPAPGGWQLPAVQPDQLAYVLHTSGSTGTPKGVAVRRANLSWFAAAMKDAPGVDSTDTVLAMTTLSFDISAFELWATLAVGGQVLIVDRDVASDGLALRERAVDATVIQATPSTWRMLLDSGWTGDRTVKAIAAGEVLTPDLAAELLDHCRELWNGYGPTETTVYATLHRVVDTTAAIPIGRPVPGALARVVNRRGRPVPPGVVGELWIGGAGVTAGYVGAPDLTFARFHEDGDGQRWYASGDLVRWRPDGALDYLGRKDDQIKVRGHRIEPGEVEAVLRAHPSVADAAVGARGPVGEQVLVGWWVPVTPSNPPEAAELAAHAAATLPGYVVPSQWVRVDELPVSPSGKVDRRALPDPVPAQGDGDPPLGPVEELVAGIWCRVLGLSVVRRDADFFALGGHSLAATKVIAALRDELDLLLRASVLFDAPQLSAFAARVTEALLADENP